MRTRGKRRWLAAVAVALVGWSALTLASDWPQWRGPQRTGVSAETGLLPNWPAAGPRLVWRVADVGAGFSTPAVAGNRLFVQVNRGVDDELVQARDIADGRLIWETRIGRVGNPDQQPSYPGARSTPTVDGDAIYALGSDGDLAALDRASGRVRWTRHLRTDFGGKSGTWAYAESPLVDGNVLVATPGGAASLVALEKKTGKEIWRSTIPGNEDAGYASIVIVQAGGVKQYVTFLQKGLVSVDAKTGAFLWRYDEPGTGSAANMATAIAHDGLVFATTNQVGGGAVRLSVDGAKVTATPVYFNKRLGIGPGGAVLVGQHLYGANAQGLLAIDLATGTVAWQNRGVGAASVAAAEGRLYVRGEGGEVALVEATPTEYREQGRFTPPDAPDRGKARAWPHPVVANGRLYLRDLGTLWAYDVAAR
jgi:outer membrane protein assembly factor BamB